MTRNLALQVSRNFVEKYSIIQCYCYQHMTIDSIANSITINPNVSTLTFGTYPDLYEKEIVPVKNSKN